MTYTLGISYGFHDATAALAKDGRIIAMSAEERFTRQKHDQNFPAAAVEHCLRAGGIAASDLARVVYHESPSQTFTRVVASSLAGFPRSRREFTGAMKAWLGKKLWVEGELGRRLGVPPSRLACLSHHESHAYQAFLGSGWDEAAVLTVDAVGEWATTALARATRTADGVPRMETLSRVEFPHSLGLVYSAFTAYLGFVPMDGECSVMALAAFGEPRFARAIRRMVVAAGDEGFRVDQSYFNFHRFYAEPWTPRLVADLGPPRGCKDPLPFDCLGAGGAVSVEAQRFADVAASVQLVFEETMLALARRLKRLTGASRLCLAGGAALNCVANTRLLEESGFDDVYVPPDPGDGGAAAGAALAAAATTTTATAGPAHRPYQPYVGPAVTLDATSPEVAMLAHVDPAHHRRFAKHGYVPPRGERWTHDVIDDEAALVAAVAELLAGGAIVGWVQGAAESGPRALGARSILIRPDDPALALRLSDDVKARARYRPYALAMSAEHAPRILAAERLDASPYKWMQLAASVRPAARQRVAAGLHVDGTTRPQVCSASDHPRFHALLRAVGARTGLDCLINTSFNESGQPIVSTPLEALAVFARTGMDALVIDKLLVRKTR